ncbi:glycosyltransferase [Flavobacterium sp. 123]|uniref:glycosyltransferase n=1 Tax=Flavobacterium sp. 123 TaxID=2135627 RepID=UPI000EAE3F65|nr:glycosyltransferase [Flavobacterium sp. 123]RKS99987.1 glycosyltransferase involved in cell wall biosynthesis [Flavobacterium sp. 123]
MENSICFYFPYHEDSGVPVLFYRMANAVAQKKPDISVSIIDFEDGAMARNLLPLPNIHLIVFEKNKKVSPPKDSVLVMQTFVPYYWPDELDLDVNQKIFFWNLHPQNLIPSLLPIPFLRELPMNNFGVYRFCSNFYKTLFSNLRAYVQLLQDKEALYFMDKSNLDFSSKYLFTNIEMKQYLPVPAVSSSVELNFNEPKSLKDTINVGWIGRLCDFKSYILVYTINKLSDISHRFDNKKFVYHIVGNGPFLDYIKNNIILNKNVSVVFHGSIPHDKLDNFINGNFDVMTAMGTSALEGAKLAKPTILLDFTFKKIEKDYLFREIYDTVGFDLAHFITDKDYDRGNDSLFEIVNGIILDYTLHAQKAFEYYENNHSIEKVQELFLQKALNTKLSFSMIDPSVLRKSKLLRFYNKLRKLEN